jgi:hypothetical protein
MKTHELKSWPDYFEPVFHGQKCFELRNNDRRFSVGDRLLIREWDDRTGKYTGREVRKIVSYMLEGVGPGAITPLHGLSRGYVILSLASEPTAYQIEHKPDKDESGDDMLPW